MIVDAISKEDFIKIGTHYGYNGMMPYILSIQL